MTDLPVPASQPVDRRHAQHSLDSLDSFIDQAHADAIRLQERGDVVGLGDGLERLRAILAKLRDLEREVEDMTAGLMDRKVIVEEGIGMERRQGKDRRAWQSEELLRRLVGDRLVDPETGENLYETLIECVPFTGSLGWRVTALRKHGIDPEEWCDETPGRVSVRVWRGDDDA